MKRVFTLAALAALMCSCSGDNAQDTPQPVEPAKIPITISTDVWTRVTDSAYERGDMVGIYVVNTPGSLVAQGNHVDNMRFTYSSAWTPDKEIYWKDQTTPADFYCYYPYSASADVSAHKVSVRADQSALADYKASEFLWGKTSGVRPTTSAVHVKTARSMSNMLIYLKGGKGFTEESFAAATKSVKVCHVKTAATVDLHTGVATAEGAAQEMTPYNEGGYYRALVVPQTVAEGTQLITTTVDGVDYVFTKGFTFKANTQHKFTITVNKQSGGVNVDITDWETDNTDHGGSAE